LGGGDPVEHLWRGDQDLPRHLPAGQESPYIEAAQAYGAGKLAHHLRYLDPAHHPAADPAALVVLIPTFVFLEASLAVLGWAIRSCPPGAR
jgi:ABC-type dipeptide/oligopeptide/nickel transport system permease subunit